MNTTNGGGSYEHGMPITLEDEPLFTPESEARRFAWSVAFAVGFVVALILALVVPHFVN